MTIGETHPSAKVIEFARTLGSGTSFELSYYNYKPQSLLDERRTFRIAAKDLNEKKVAEFLSNLRPNEELAFHSTIIVGTRRRLHLPLIDFAGKLENESLSLVEQILGAKLFQALLLYQSGRSFHGYVFRPLTGAEWIRFMGSLLLMNLPGQPPISDARWIGHRLRAGFASLRWSRNTPQYLAYPTLVSATLPGFAKSPQC
ncbi:hypothetical protein [Cystobacter fuscus]|uniref:primase 1D-like protein n=1 Tax=Cystobacter fuscus TaxID=43 RepID=UPI0012FE6F91|nr:hypothetical protein [Cystobacter fuscus]